jgi:anti-sigma factor RsiW
MNREQFSKNIPTYLDGLMRDEERLEFEAIVGSNPEFARLFREKEADYQAVKRRIPDIHLDQGAHQRLEEEVRESIHNLFRDEAADPKTKVTRWFQELF